jgi:Na+/melibiose symporter-like transporter
MIEFLFCCCCSDYQFYRIVGSIIGGFLEITFGITILVNEDKTMANIFGAIFLLIAGILSLVWTAINCRKYDLEENSANNQSNIA